MKFRTLHSSGMNEDELKPLYDLFHKLPKENQDRIIAELEGNTDKIVIPEKFKIFCESLNLINEFIDSHSLKGYSIDTELNNGLIIVRFTDIVFTDARELKEIFDNTVAVEFRLTDTHIIELVIQYDITTKMGVK